MPMLDVSTPAVLIVDDDTTAIRVLGKAVAGLARISFATSGQDALKQAREAPPDLVLLDAEMPGMSGFQLCQAMKADPVLADVPVIFVTSHGDEATEEAGLALGAVDFIAKPIRPAIVAARVRTHLRLKLASDRLQRLAETDGLTGLANRRILDQVVEREWHRARRSGSPLSLLMIDVDFFKRYNDTYGHLQGDQCLIAVAGALRRCVGRESDLVARYGGEEFVVLLPETGGAGARRLAEGILAAVRDLALPHQASELGSVSVSVGVASFDQASRGWESCGARAEEIAAGPERLLALADQALYRAKQAGRCRSCFAQLDL